MAPLSLISHERCRISRNGALSLVGHYVILRHKALKVTILGERCSWRSRLPRIISDSLIAPEMTAAGAIIRLPGVSRATIYKYVPEGTTGRAAAALPPGQE